MGEYGREQRNQESRAIANNGAGSRQLKKNVDNRNHNILQMMQSTAIMQYKFGMPPDTLVDHLKGLWSGKGDGTPKGGHWKNGMEEKWQGWHKDKAATLKGVHCDKDLNADSPTYEKTEYTIKNERKLSKKKTSSFWPASWNEATLKDKLNNSDIYKTNVWKTVDNIYWYAGGSAYPITKDQADGSTPYA